ncbi:hypothetical protein BS50DRAFT_321642 [Corynespora cassiicola Philippines]|uniref:Uncharacterized protein n=1 Tax=Corynespora cassiicola Philippines TaxID=1448308 RepID=A0A2T2NU95_CORCC|nr:hypothetical protein BS50DRAFT_321642 [Corynespora cassiicola Philippines]
MSSCCRTCDHRNHAVNTSSNSAPILLDVCLIALSFKTPVSSFHNPKPYSGLQHLLWNIKDAADSTSHPTTFTRWSPCLMDPKKVVILTTASETCSHPNSSVFEPVLKYLASPPHVQHVLLDYSVTSLASSHDERTPCDVIVLRAPNPGIAGAIGKRFGWDPKRSSLSAHMESCAPAAFSRPGDLVRDFWAWAEIQPSAPESPSTTGSVVSSNGYESNPDYSRPNGGGLISTNSDEKNMALFFAEDDERRNMEDETLVMLFQWSSHVNADRFKHPLQKSYGQNGEEVSADLWDRHVAHPVRQLTGVGAKADMYKLELRDVEDRPESSRAAVRMRSGSARLSVMANRMSGLWK